jgi:hypothetical protein
MHRAALHRADAPLAAASLGPAGVVSQRSVRVAANFMQLGV